MSVPKSERLQELQAALTLRQREIAQLTSRKSQLLELQRENHKSSKLGSASSSATPEEDPVAPFVADHPVFSFCYGRHGEELVWSLPIEQIGNVIAQFDAGMVALTQKLKDVKRACDAVSVKQRKTAAAEVRIDQQIRSLADATGLPTSQLSTRPSATAKLKSAPIAAMLEESAAAPAGESLTELRKMVNAARKEIHMVEVMKKKNLIVIQQFDRLLLKQQDIKDDIIRQRNKIRCLQRDISEKKVELENILSEHEALDRKLTIAMKPKSEDRTRAILDRDVSDLKRQMEDCVEGERRVQERVVKAQEYRILQLEKRLASVKRALQDHKLTNRVEEAILASLAGQEGDDSMSRSPGSRSSSLSPNRDLPQGVDLSNKAALYNIDLIVPPQELVHPALYSLLASEKDSLAGVVSQQQTTLREKDQSAEALAYEVAKLTLSLDEAQTLLDMTTSQIALVEDEQQDNVVEEVLVQREQYRTLLQSKNHLRRGLNNQHSVDGSSGPSASRSPHQDPKSASSDRSITPRQMARSPATNQPEPHGESAERVGSPSADLSENATHTALRKSSSKVRFADDGQAEPLNETQPPCTAMPTEEF